MSNTYDSMVFEWREHMKVYASKPPKQFELTQDAFDALNAARKAVLSAGKYTLPPGWEVMFYGTPVLVIDGCECFVVDHTGLRRSLGTGSRLASEASSHCRRMSDD